MSERIVLPDNAWSVYRHTKFKVWSTKEISSLPDRQVVQRRDQETCSSGHFQRNRCDDKDTSHRRHHHALQQGITETKPTSCHRRNHHAVQQSVMETKPSSSVMACVQHRGCKFPLEGTVASQRRSDARPKILSLKYANLGNSTRRKNKPVLPNSGQNHHLTQRVYTLSTKVSSNIYPASYIFYKPPAAVVRTMALATQTAEPKMPVRMPLRNNKNAFIRVGPECHPTKDFSINEESLHPRHPRRYLPTQAGSVARVAPYAVDNDVLKAPARSRGVVLSEDDTFSTRFSMLFSAVPDQGLLGPVGRTTQRSITLPETKLTGCLTRTNVYQNASNVYSSTSCGSLAPTSATSFTTLSSTGNALLFGRRDSSRCYGNSPRFSTALRCDWEKHQTEPPVLSQSIPQRRNAFTCEKHGDHKAVLGEEKDGRLRLGCFTSASGIGVHEQVTSIATLSQTSRSAADLTVVDTETAASSTRHPVSSQLLAAFSTVSSHTSEMVATTVGYGREASRQAGGLFLEAENNERPLFDHTKKEPSQTVIKSSSKNLDKLSDNAERTREVLTDLVSRGALADSSTNCGSWNIATRHVTRSVAMHNTPEVKNISHTWKCSEISADPEPSGMRDTVEQSKEDNAYFFSPRKESHTDQRQAEPSASRSQSSSTQDASFASWAEDDEDQYTLIEELPTAVMVDQNPWLLHEASSDGEQEEEPQNIFTTCSSQMSSGTSRSVSDPEGPLKDQSFYVAGKKTDRAVEPLEVAKSLTKDVAVNSTPSCAITSSRRDRKRDNSVQQRTAVIAQSCGQQRAKAISSFSATSILNERNTAGRTLLPCGTSENSMIGIRSETLPVEEDVHSLDEDTLQTRFEEGEDGWILADIDVPSGLSRQPVDYAVGKNRSGGKIVTPKTSTRLPAKKDEGQRLKLPSLRRLLSGRFIKWSLSFLSRNFCHPNT